MANDIAPDYLRGKVRADPRFQQALRALPHWAFDKVERIFDPNRGYVRVFGYYDNFDATIELDPEPMVLHPMFEDWVARQPPETAPATAPTGGTEADWQTPALAIAGERGIDPQQMRGMTQLEAARYLQSNDPATLAPEVGRWIETLTPEQIAALESGGPPPADMLPLPYDLLRSLHARAAASDGRIRARPASDRATRTALWDMARDRNVDPAPLATMTDADAWDYVLNAEPMQAPFDETYGDLDRRAFIGQPEPAVDPDARAPASEGGQAVGETALGFAPGIGTMIGAKDLVASYRAAQSARARGDEKVLAEANRMMGLSLIGLLPFMAGITRVGKGAKVIRGVSKGNRAGKAAKGPHAMATEGTARVLPKLPKVSRTENPVTLQEFARMPDEGVIDARRIRTAQNTADDTFKDGRSVAKMVKELRDEVKTAADIDPIRIVEKDGKIWTLDHRRLIAFREAGVRIRFQKVEYKNLNPRQRKKFTTKDDGLSIEIVRGKKR